MSMTDVFTSRRPQLPDIRGIHWLFRALIAAIILQQALLKTPLTPDAAEGAGVPFFLFALAAFGEYCAATALIAGGFIRNAFGDLLTRAGGLTVALITFGVLYVVYWAPPMDLFLANQLHLLLIIGGLYFAARGNAA